MLKKIFIGFTMLLILTAGILTVFREEIFIPSIKINFDNPEITASCKAIILKNNKEKNIDKPCAKYKLKAKYNSKVIIDIITKDSPQIVMIKNGYERLQPAQFKNELKITEHKDKTSVEIEKVKPNSKNLINFFEHPLFHFVLSVYQLLH